MEIIFELLTEIFFDVFVEGFAWIASAFVPDGKLSDRAERIIGIVVAVISILLLIGLMAGVILVVGNGGKSLFGWIFIAAALAYTFFGILLKIISVVRK